MYGSGIMPGLQQHQLQHDHHQLQQQQHSQHLHPLLSQHESKDTLSELHQNQHQLRSSVVTPLSNNEHHRVSSTEANIHNTQQKEMPNDQLLSPAENQDDETNSSTVVAAGQDRQQYLNELNQQEEEEHNMTNSHMHNEKVALREGAGEGNTRQQEQLVVGRGDHVQHKGTPSTTITDATAGSSTASSSSRLDGLKQAFGNSLLIPPSTGMGEGLSGSGSSLSSASAAATGNPSSSFGSFGRPSTTSTALATTSCSLSSSSSDCFSAPASASASVSSVFPTDLLSRYRLEQTLRHLHSFQDPRIAALPFNSSSATATGIHQQDQL